MLKAIENYYLHILKPTLMITTFYFDIKYIGDSKFPNDFFKDLYFITLSLKPLFFFGLLIGFLIYSKSQKMSDFFITCIILINIYFGFPIKEYADFFSFDELNKFFLGKQYSSKDYVLSHFIVNLIIENFPVLIFVFINNQIMNKFHMVDNTPLIINVIFLMLNIFFVSFLRFT